MSDVLEGDLQEIEMSGTHPEIMAEYMPLVADLMAPAGQPQELPQSKIPTALIRMRSERGRRARPEPTEPIPIWEDSRGPVFPPASAEKKIAKPRRPSRLIMYDQDDTILMTRLQRVRAPTPVWARPALRLRGRVRAWIWLKLRALHPPRDL